MANLEGLMETDLQRNVQSVLAYSFPNEKKENLQYFLLLVNFGLLQNLLTLTPTHKIKQKSTHIIASWI